MRCKYPKWAMNKVLLKQEGQKKSTSRKQNPTAPQVEKKCHIVVPYSQGPCKSYKPFVVNMVFRYISKEGKF